MLSNIEIQNIIPHRYPFLLIDKIEEVEPGKRAVAIKNVSINEPFFQGHFPKPYYAWGADSGSTGSNSLCSRTYA